MNADYIFKNSTIITVNPKDEIAEAIAISKNKILYVGTNLEAMSFADEKTKVFDMTGKTITPGFIDAHQHTSHGSACKYVFGDLDPSKAPNKQALFSIVKQEVSKAPKGSWVLFWGYDEIRMEEGCAPTVSELDEIAPENPVLLGRFCGHVGCFNSLALEIGTINLDTAANFAKGQVEIMDGKLTGQLYETAYYHMWNFAEVAEDIMLHALSKQSQALVQVGVTSVHDAGGFGSASYSAYSKAMASGLFKPRVMPMFFNLFGKEKVKQDIRTYISLGLGPVGNEKLRYNLMKIMIDGSSSAPSCAVTIPYCHNGGTGIVSMEQDEIDAMALEIHKAGLQATAHCVGDKAIHMWVSAMEKAQAAFPREDARHRIEHCALPTPALLERIAALNMLPIPNTRFISLNGERYIKFYGERAANIFPCRSMLDAGIIPVMGTDSPIVPEQPLLGISSAIDRKTLAGTPLGPDQNITVLEAIRMYTYNGAYATFEETIKGSLEPGKLADLAVFDGDILNASSEQLEAMHCILTMIDGEIAHSSN